MDPVSYEQLIEPTFQKGCVSYNAITLVRWMSAYDDEHGCKNVDPVTREPFTFAERHAVFESFGLADPRTHQLFLALAQITVGAELQQRLASLDDATRDAVVRYHMQPSGLTLLMHAAVEARPDCVAAVLGVCSDPTYVNAVDSSNRTALANLFYWNLAREWSWDDHAEDVATMLVRHACTCTFTCTFTISYFFYNTRRQVRTPGVCVAAAIRVLRGVHLKGGRDVVGVQQKSDAGRWLCMIDDVTRVLYNTA